LSDALNWIASFPALKHPERNTVMPMLDVYAAAGTFADRHKLAQDLAKALMKWENVPPINLFKTNTAAFIHELASEAISNAAGGSNYVRVQVLTPINVLNREKQLDVVRELTDIVGAAAGDPTLVNRTWMLITEAAEGGWGINRHANRGAEIGAAARAELGNSDRTKDS
jgi:phenylpyruvate tautomerase PptA (4-oxalocrotonate tautomerase family)